MSTAILGPFFTYFLDGVWLRVSDPETRSMCLSRKSNHITRFFVFRKRMQENTLALINWLFLDLCISIIYPFLVVCLTTLRRRSWFRALLAGLVGKGWRYRQLQSIASRHTDLSTHSTAYRIWRLILDFPWLHTYIFAWEVLAFLFMTYQPNLQYTETPGVHMEWGFGQIYAMFAALLAVIVSLVHAWSDEVEIDEAKRDAFGNLYLRRHYLSHKNYWNQGTLRKILGVVDSYHGRNPDLDGDEETKFNPTTHPYEHAPIPLMSLYPSSTQSTLNVSADDTLGYFDRRLSTRRRRHSWTPTTPGSSTVALLPMKGMDGLGAG
ncbi:hypothetical protein BJ508DRAFT_335122 [Ascobolus immersus RN42]|uniref:Uncharacterized protein n=1 Tax=Ascobolus immersus RN42 TaxID=1160509 RepID=A0A3N4HJN0_ASCIM|nr:hypothetical protein BJ508DRAFT_335122 [Ascobolus immersus RN42]